MKTLLEYYDEIENARMNKKTAGGVTALVSMSNRPEFIGYFLLLQIGSGGLSRLLRCVRPEVLASEPLQFVLRVWAAYSKLDYPQFFRLLSEEANLLQGCLMHRYVGTMRLHALRSLAKGLTIKKDPAYYPVHELVKLLMFEDEEDCVDFAAVLGLETADGEGAEGLCVILDSKSLSLPKDKNGHDSGIIFIQFVCLFYRIESIALFSYFFLPSLLFL